VEHVLSQWPEQAAVVRLTKVVGPNSIFAGWARSLLAGQPIRPFTDMVVSPIPLTTVVSILRLVGDQQRGGIWQISGERDVTYSEAAFWGGKILGVNLSLIRPWAMAEAGLELEVNPANTTMDTERLRQDLGLEPPPVNWSIENSFWGRED
jgi:dTDP-4-dehydrorhamnose reductase